MGEGPVDLAWQFDWLSNVDTIPESDHFATQFSSLASFSRVILHDRRATGLSSRNVAVPNLETRVSDLVAVLDAVDARRPVLGGEREGCAPNALLAATDPERIRSLIWYEPTLRSTWAPDYPWGARPEYVEREAQGPRTLGHDRVRGSLHRDRGRRRPRHRPHLRRDGRQAEPPHRDARCRPRLTRVGTRLTSAPCCRRSRCPRCSFPTREAAAGTSSAYAAGLMPDARTRILAGSESDNDLGEFVEAIRGFLGVDTAPSMDTVLTTVMFTDIVDSTPCRHALAIAPGRT